VFCTSIKDNDNTLLRTDFDELFVAAVALSNMYVPSLILLLFLRVIVTRDSDLHSLPTDSIRAYKHVITRKSLDHKACTS